MTWVVGRQFDGMTPSHVIFVVDDTPAIVELACCILRCAGLECRGFTSAEALLEAFVPETVDCIVTDLKMPSDGEELYRWIRLKDSLVSFVFISGEADIKTVVRIMEQGAVTLVEKPFTPETLVAAVRRGVERTGLLRSLEADQREAVEALATLTRDERDVLECMVRGLPNKGIADALSLSLRTVDRRRHSLLKKMHVDSVAELAALVSRLPKE